MDSEPESGVESSPAGEELKSEASEPDAWRVVASSVRGVGHERSGLPCQDAHAWRVRPEGALILAVADGAGSAAHSDIGAQIAVETAVMTLYAHPVLPSAADSEQYWADHLLSVMEGVRSVVEAEAVARALEVRELASTLILLVAQPGLLAVAQIGDGAVVAQNREGGLFAVTTPQNGEFANETVFLVSPDAFETAQATVWRGALAHVAVFSDGLQNIALTAPHDTPYPPFFAPLFRFAAEAREPVAAAEELAAFLRSPRFAERTDDDLTLALATLLP